jgi:phosphatidylinositol alpha-1,6-mannosyltransferase
MITQDFPPQVGGIQTYSAELAERLAGRCTRFEVVAPRDPDFEAYDRDAPYRVHRLPLGADGMRVTTVAALPALARGFDATFHAQWYTAHAGLLARALGLVRSVFVAAHGREILLNEPAAWSAATGRAFAGIRRGVLRRVDRFFVVSHYTGTLVTEQGVDPERVVVVPNGVDPDRRHPVDATAWRTAHGLGDAPLLVTLARLVPRKGIDTVLRSLPAVRSRHKTVRYAVAGGGPDRDRLERLAAELGVGDCVSFLGRVPDEDKNACLSAADVFVMPARSEPPDVEGFGLVFLEANACGRPVVGARTGGVPDAIVPGHSGELVDPDDPAALADVVASLLSDPARANAMGARGRARVEEACTWDHVADRLYAAMQEALA